MKQNKKKVVIITLCFIVVVAIVVIALLNIFKPKETYIKSKDSFEAISSLYCTSSNVNGAFFHDETARKEVNEIKFSYKDGKIDKMQFTYTGDYPNAEMAKSASDRMHYNYNTFMDNTSVKFSDLSPNFSVIDKQVIVNLFFDEKTATAETASLLFLTDSDTGNYKNNTLSTMKKKYENKGFSCKITK